MTTDANDLEVMAKEHPNECFLKGSGVLKLIGAIRTLEAQVAALKAQPAPTEAQDEPTAEQYDEMLRALCCQYGVGGYNSDGLINPDVAGEKLTAALDEQFRVGGEMALKKVQGEDSARLADGYISGTVISDSHATWVALRYESMEKAEVASDLIFGIIDKENGFSCAASQPQEQS